MLLILLVHYAFAFYTLMLFTRILVSWVPELGRYSVIQWVFRCTDPYLNIFRQIIPPLGVIDISPIVAFLALRLVEHYVVMPFLSMIVSL
jgi:YggT family protein